MAVSEARSTGGPCLLCRACRALVPLADSFGPLGGQSLVCAACGDTVLSDGKPAQTAESRR